MDLRRVIPLLLALSAAAAQAQTTRFDGDWKVTLSCPPHAAAQDDAKGYTHHFAGSVVQGEFSATHGTKGEPGWHFLRGPIGPGGEAALRLDGIVKSPDHAINNAGRGKPYSYRVKARFTESAGTGQRLTGRICEFTFSR